MSGIPVSITVNPRSVEPGDGARLVIQLASPPLGGAGEVVSLSFSENPTVPGEQLLGAIPVSIMIPNGQTTGSWWLRTMPGTSGGSVIVGAEGGPTANSATLAISS